MPAQPGMASLPNTRTVTITRVLDAPRALVWQAWTDPKHLREWWGPQVFTNPVCEVDARVGGRIRIVMRGPKETAFDQDFPMSGTFHEVVEAKRLVFTAVAEDKNGNPLLEARTTVTFEDAPGGKTRLIVRADGKGMAPIAPQMLAGMEDGWSQSLDKLAALVTRIG